MMVRTADEMSESVGESQSCLRLLSAPSLEGAHLDAISQRVVIEARWLVNGGHGASLRHHKEGAHLDAGAQVLGGLALHDVGEHPLLTPGPSNHGESSY